MAHGPRVPGIACGPAVGYEPGGEIASAATATRRAVTVGSSACMTTDCELCGLARTTTWYAQYDEPCRFTILDCDSCDVPMAVLGAHRRAPTEEERAVMQQALARVADAKYPHGWFFDDHMRQIPDHYHLHARPYPRWWPRRT